MNRFIARHKKLIAILLLFSVLFWLLTLQVKNGRFPILEKPVLAVSGLIERIIAWPFDTAASLGRGYFLLVGVERENRQLHDENDRLRIENDAANELLVENNRLRELLNFRQQQRQSVVPAQVIGKTLYPSSCTITIDKGANAGIRKDMAVVAQNGVVGRVQTVLDASAKIVLLTDPGCTLAVRSQRNREEGLLEGRLINCALKYVSYYADIQEGDLLVTSGLDGVFPKGLPVATVVKVVKREASAFQSVTVEPAVRFSRLEEVLVLIP